MAESGRLHSAFLTSSTERFAAISVGRDIEMGDLLLQHEVHNAVTITTLATTL